MTQREEFEKWFNVYDAEIKIKSQVRELMFVAWKASRKNMPRIELPAHSTGEWSMYKQSRNQAIDECKQAIHEAGFEVENEH